MTQDYRKQKRIKEAQKNPEASLLADNPTDVGYMGFVEPPDAKENFPVPEVAKQPELEEEKGFAGTSYWKPFGGSLSFDELEAYENTLAEVEHMESVTHQFRSIIENVLMNDDVPHNEKAIMIQTAAAVYTGKLQSFEKEKGFFEKVKDFFNKDKDLPDSAMGVIKTKDGYRWFGHFSNNYKDREGEIITAEAHKEFVAYLKENPDRMPLFRMWHIVGTDREKEADFVEYFDGFMVASGPLSEKEAEQLEKAIAYDDGKTGMSHGMYVLQRDSGNANYITKYRSFEISDLPLANAANGFTGINTKEVYMSKDKLERLKITIGEEAAEKIIDQIGDSKEVLEELGVESKEEEIVVEEVEDETEGEAEEVVEDEAKEQAEEEINPEAKELALAIAKELGLEELGEILHKQEEVISDLQDEIKELSKSEDEKIAEQIEDKSLGALLWRASESDENLVPEEELEEIENQKPSATAWVEEVM